MAWVSDHNLAAAVSEAGGLGTIGAGHMPPGVLDKEILETQLKTKKPFAVNLMLLNPDVEKQMEVVIKRQVPIVIMGAGDASSHIKKFQEQGIKVLAIAPSISLAKRLAKKGVDVIIVEGSEAGGHIGKFSTMVLLPAIIEALKDESFDIPIIAAGGICDGKTFVAAMILGASGVQIGTRFVLAAETNIHPNVKKAYIDASDVTKVVVTGQAIGLPAQCLRNQLTKDFDEWDKEFILSDRSNSKREEIELRAVGRLREAMQEGNVKSGSVMAGQCVVRLNKDHLNQKASEIIGEIVAGAEEILKNLPEAVV
jgi:enoyl-[acyl-carrier protein] reductase II